MICNRCKNEIKADDMFCGKCGTKVFMQNSQTEFNNANGSQSNLNPQNTNIQQPQPVSPNSQFVVEQAMKNESKRGKLGGGKLGLIISIAVALLFAMGATCYYFISMNNPTNIYRNFVKKGITEIYDTIYKDYDKMNTTVNMDFDLDLEQEILEQNLLDLINKTTIVFNYQMDKDSEKQVLKLDSDYGKDSLIDLQLFIDSKNKKSYLYAKDYYDKYLEVEMDDYSSFTELFEGGELSIGQTINAKKIIIDEFTKIIESEDCSKEDGAYVLKITEKEMLNRIKTAMINLKNNQKFLDCYEEPNVIKDNISSIIDDIDVESASTETIKISINKKMLSSKIDKLVVSSMNVEVIFENKGEETTYKFNSENELVLSGYIKLQAGKNTTKSEFLVEIPEFGKLKVNLDTINENNKDIDKFNTSNVKSFDDITEEEQFEIMTKIQESKISEIITLISEILGMNDNSYDDGINDDFDVDFDDDTGFVAGTTDSINVYDYRIITYNIPEGFNNTFDSDTYKIYKKDDIEIIVKAYSYESEDDYFKALSKTVEYAKEDKYYKDVVLSNKNTKLVGGTTYYYKDYSYEYIGIISNTKYYTKHICTNIGNDYYLIFEITSKNNAISDSLLDVILSIN